MKLIIVERIFFLIEYANWLILSMNTINLLPMIGLSKILHYFNIVNVIGQVGNKYGKTYSEDSIVNIIK